MGGALFQVAAPNLEGLGDTGMPILLRVTTTAHVVLAVVHLYWATGTTWPADDTRSLSNAVIGGEVSFAPGVLLPLAAFHLVLAAALATCARHRAARVVVMGLVLGLSARAAVGLVWVLGIGSDTATPFYWLNLFVYTPACVLLAGVDLAILRGGVRRTGVTALVKSSPA